MTKSGAMPTARIALQIDRNSVRAPMHSLNPIGLPPDSLRRVAMNWTNSVGVENALCAGGDTTVLPIGTPRVAAISALTLAPGSTPPKPGLAPWDNLIEIALTDGNRDFSANATGSKRPSASRQPK